MTRRQGGLVPRVLRRGETTGSNGTHEPLERLEPAPQTMREPEPAPRVAEPEPLPAPEPEPVAPPAEPGFRGPLEATLRHPFIVIFLTVLLTGAGIAAGLLRDPVYTSDARVNVGRIDVPAYTLQGVLIGNTTLAVGYSRAIEAQPVIAAAAKQTGLPESEVRSSMSASPVPQSTLIEVEGEAPTAAQAIALANAGADGLVDYVTKTNTYEPSTDMLEQYRVALQRIDRAQREVAQAYRLDPPDPRAVERAMRKEAATRLAATTISNQYRTLEGTADVQVPLRVIVSAATADSDRDTWLQQLGFIGLVAGLLLGLALALLRANRHLLRRPK